MSSQDTVLGGRYRLETVIGRGGMAEVWRARDERLGRPVAVKRLRIDLASDPTFLARFRREAQAAAGLNHPNIVSVYDTGEATDPSGINVPYIVMELVTGHTLRDVLRDGRKILPERALEFLRGVLEALAYSHRQGIVHRDIKPANVMLTGTGQVKVMDFGIARAVADTSATMTQTAAVIGTAQYLSPEQARGETVDQRSDIYSAGCLLYELLVGRPPFIGDSPVSVAYQHVREAPVPPSHLDPEITADMDAITLTALAKDPADRYQDADAMGEDIDRLLSGREVTAVLPAPVAVVPDPEPTAVAPVVGATAAGASVGRLSPDPDSLDEDEQRRSRGTAVLVGLVALLLVALGIGVWQVLKPDPAPPVAMTTVPLVEGLQEQAAKSTIINAKLTVGDVTYVNGEDATRGQVIEQNPAGQRQVPEQTEVDLTVNLGVKTQKIPDDLVGKTEQEVTDILTTAGFEVSREDADPSDVPPEYVKGQVVSTNPSSGADWPVGGEVTIAVATGVKQVPTTLVGMSYTEAAAVLEKAGYKPTKVDAPQPERVEWAKDEVVEVRPSGGTTLEQGSEVQLVVATGQSRVPNLRGKTLTEAQSMADDAGFKVTSTEQESSSTPGLVIEQSPSDSGLAVRGSTIEVVIAKAPPPPPSSAPPSSPEPSTTPATSGGVTSASSSPGRTPSTTP